MVINLRDLSAISIIFRIFWFLENKKKNKKLEKNLKLFYFNIEIN
jgi:hypothetical protein